MKTYRLIFLLLIVTGINSAAQLNKEPTDLLDKVYINKIIKFDSVSITGSPFLDAAFMTGAVEDSKGNVYLNVLLRYNVYNDYFEFEKEGIAYILEPEEFAVVAELDDKIYIYSEYIDKGKQTFGYMEIMAAGYCSLYKKHTVAYYPPKPPAPFQESSPSGRFSKMAPKYYIGFESNLLLPIGTEKAFIDIVGDREESVKSYIKQNKLKFRKEEDLIEIIEFINK